MKELKILKNPSTVDTKDCNIVVCAEPPYYGVGAEIFRTTDIPVVCFVDEFEYENIKYLKNVFRVLTSDIRTFMLLCEQGLLNADYMEGATPERINEYLVMLLSCVDYTIYTDKYYNNELTYLGKRIGYKNMNREDTFHAWAADLLVTSFGLKGKRLLDFGAARGYLVEELRKLGVDAYGVDPAVETETEYLKKTFEHFKPESFDVIFSSETLEHIYEKHVPGYLTLLSKFLKPNGLFISTISLAETRRIDEFTHINLKPRWWWQEKLTDAGLYKHPEETTFYNKGYPEWRWFVYQKVVESV